MECLTTLENFVNGNPAEAEYDVKDLGAWGALSYWGDTYGGLYDNEAEKTECHKWLQARFA